eukprot:gene13087-13214_t
MLLEHAAKIKAHELRGKNKQELINQLNELKTELAALRVAKTVYRANIRTALRSKIENDGANKKGKTFLPLDLRVKKTRALRRALTTEQKNLLTKKEQKRGVAFPSRKFAVKA